MNSQHWFSIFSFLIFVSVVGCGSSDPRGHHVRGDVTYDGKPVPYGEIQFIPSSGNNGPPGRATIEAGKFDTSQQGNQGTVGGAHTVVITGFNGEAKPEAELPHGEVLFENHREEIDVPMQGGAMETQFRIKGE